MDNHRDEVYRCRLNLCLGEAPALASLYDAAVDADNFSRTLSDGEREAPVELDTCRPGAEQWAPGGAGVDPSAPVQSLAIRHA